MNLWLEIFKSYYEAVALVDILASSNTKLPKDLQKQSIKPWIPPNSESQPCPSSILPTPSSPPKPSQNPTKEKWQL
jgi:hypothetical protein